jgi:hypothetical protein
MPHFQKYHSSVIIFTFASFTFNDPRLYTKQSEHLSLIIGFTQIGNLAASFVSTNWL